MHLAAHEGPQDKLPCLSILVRECSLFSSRNTAMATAYLKIKIYCLLKDVGWNIRWPERLMNKNGCLLSPSGCANMGGGRRGRRKQVPFGSMGSEYRALTVRHPFPSGMFSPVLSSSNYSSPLGLLFPFGSICCTFSWLPEFVWSWLSIWKCLLMILPFTATPGSKGREAECLLDHCACSGNTCI